jgi:serine/threonine-protein kinase SRK2
VPQAAEVFDELDHDPWAADVWSLGCLLYVMLTGRVLYKVPHDVYHRSLMAGNLLTMLKAREEKHGQTVVAPLAKDLLLAMLQPDMHARLTLEQVLSHPWTSTANGGGDGAGGLEAELEAELELPC